MQEGALEQARASAKAALDDLVKAGVITRYEEWDDFDEEDDSVDDDVDALYFAVYAKSRQPAEEVVAGLTIKLYGQHGVPVLFVTLKDRGERANGATACS